MLCSVVRTSPVYVSFLSFRSTYGNHFARRFMSIHILRYFRPYTQCNKFPGETLNINLLLCWLRLFFLFLSFIWLVNSTSSNSSRHGCWQCMNDSGTIGERAGKKWASHFCMNKQMVCYISECARAGDMHFSNSTFRKKLMQDNVPFDTHNLWRLLFHFISWLDDQMDGSFFLSLSNALTRCQCNIFFPHFRLSHQCYVHLIENC